jgi:hypothetical protein
MNRRAFLNAGLVLAGSSVVPGRVFAAGLALPAEAQTLLAAAARAPSSHNTQPWKIAIEEARRWTLEPDASRRLSAVDPDGRELWLSLGALCAALGAAAAAQGLALAPCREEAGRVALNFAPGPSATAAALLRRRSLRQDFAPRPGLTREWPALSEGIPKLHYIPMASAAGGEIAAATLKANARQVELDPVWEELADWIRWRHQDAVANPTGLTPETLELPWLVRQWVGALWSREDVLTRSFRLRGLDQVGQQLHQGEGWLVVTGDADSRSDWLAAGEALMRFWLRAVPASLALHPMSQALELPESRRELEAHLGLGRIQVLARLGSRAYPVATPSPRLPPAAFAHLA